MKRWIWLISILPLISMACRPDRPASTEVAGQAPGSEATDMTPLETRQMWRSQPAQMGAATELTAGPLPLVYLFERNSQVRVMDQTAGQSLAQGAVEGGTLVRIDEKKGVMFGRQTLRPGPLPADHRYSIYLEAVGGSEWRSSVTVPAPAQPRPADGGSR